MKDVSLYELIEYVFNFIKHVWLEYMMVKVKKDGAIEVPINVIRPSYLYSRME